MIANKTDCGGISESAFNAKKAVPRVKGKLMNVIKSLRNFVWYKVR